MGNLKDKTINGFIWSFIDRFSAQLINFIVGIILARLLSPTEFGLIGMLTIFIGISTVFIYSGFNQALIRKTDCSDNDYMTVFVFNLIVSVLFYIILFFSSGLISDFYGENILTSLTKVLGLVIVINSLTIVQRTVLTKTIDFKKLTKISVFSSIGSGVVGILTAIYGYGVWSLVFKQLAHGVFQVILLWYWNSWVPRGKFTRDSFKSLFSFGSNLMIMGIIDMIYKNIYHVIIGKFYPVESLGYYTKADQFKKLPSETLSGVIDRVSYPVLSKLQNDEKQFKNTFRRILKSTMLLTTIVLFGISAISEDLTIVLLGEQWAETGEYLKILAISAIFYPINRLNYSVLKVFGKSNIILRISIFLKVLSMPIILIAIFIGIKEMLFSLIVYWTATFLIIAFYTQRYIEYKWYQQVKDFIPSIIISTLMMILLYSMDYILTTNMMFNLFVKIVVGALFLFIYLEITNQRDYKYLKSTLLKKTIKHQ